MFKNLANLLKYRQLIQSLVARELKARYRGSVLGFFWSFLNPLLLLGIYSFVFGVLMPNRVPGIEPYPLFMFCGILPWTWFTSSLLESSNVLISGGNLIKKVLFPAEVLPIVTVLANMVHFFLGLPILLAFALYFKQSLDLLDLFWFPVVVLVQLVFTLGLALIVSALTVHFRDFRDLLQSIVTFWFFATPIIYPMSMAVDRGGKLFLDANPMTHIIVAYQELFFFPGAFGHWKWLLLSAAGAVGLFLLGYFVFDRLRDSFAEEV